MRAAAGVMQHLPQGSWMRLAALHIHCLAQLSRHMVVSPAKSTPVLTMRRLKAFGGMLPQAWPAQCSRKVLGHVRNVPRLCAPGGRQLCGIPACNGDGEAAQCLLVQWTFLLILMTMEGCKLMWKHAGFQEPGPKRQLNIALGILLPAPMLAQEDERGRNAAAYHQLLRLSVCPSAATQQTDRDTSLLSSGLL